MGPRGGGFVAAFVLISILGTLNATILVGPRIAYAMALDQLFLRVADRVHADARHADRRDLAPGRRGVRAGAAARELPERARLHHLRHRARDERRHARAVRAAAAPARPAAPVPRLGLPLGAARLPGRERRDRRRPAARPPARGRDRPRSCSLSACRPTQASGSGGKKGTDLFRKRTQVRDASKLGALTEKVRPLPGNRPVTCTPLAPREVVP